MLVLFLMCYLVILVMWQILQLDLCSWVTLFPFKPDFGISNKKIKAWWNKMIASIGISEDAAAAIDQ